MAKAKTGGGKPVNNPKTRKVAVGKGKTKATGGMAEACNGVKGGTKMGGSKKKM